MNKKWNADNYTKDFQFVHKYGEDVLNLLEINPGDKVIDLGCGNGALTKKIAEMGAAVTGTDASKEMIKAAKNNYPELTFAVRDATAPFIPKDPADAIFSNAVFHWIHEQDKLLTNVANELRPGGQLVCEFGGKGCTEKIHSALQKIFESKGLHYRHPFYFPTIGEYAPRLEKHDLRPIYAVLFDRFTPLTGDNGMENWIKMFITQPFQNMESELVNTIIAEAVTTLKSTLYKEGVWYADYVRIRLKAIKL